MCVSQSPNKERASRWLKRMSPLVFLLDCRPLCPPNAILSSEKLWLIIWSSNQTIRLICLEPCSWSITIRPYGVGKASLLLGDGRKFVSLVSSPAPLNLIGPFLFPGGGPDLMGSIIFLWFMNPTHRRKSLLSSCTLGPKLPEHGHVPYISICLDQTVAQTFTYGSTTSIIYARTQPRQKKTSTVTFEKRKILCISVRKQRTHMPSTQAKHP